MIRSNSNRLVNLIFQSIVLSIIACLLLPVSSSRADDYCYKGPDNAPYNPDLGVLANGQDCSGDIVIDNSVTSISPEAFNGNTNISSVTIPDSVISLGALAFQGATNLETISIGYGLTEIPAGAFFGTGLEGDLTIPSSVVSIGERAFYNSPGIGRVILGEGVETIGEGAFSGDPGFEGSLTSLTLGNSVTSIGNYAFKDQPRLTELSIPDSVTSIGVAAFAGLERLTTLNLGSGLTTIESSAFTGLRSLTSLTIPDTVVEIGTEAFNGATNLVSLTLGDSLESIGRYAFEGVGSLTTLEIPNSVTSIGDNAFNGATNLRSLTLGNSLTSIGAAAFYGAVSLESLVIPDSVFEIGEFAFAGASSLTSLTIGNSIERIKESTFSGVMALPELTIPDSVKHIEKRAFFACRLLVSLTLSDGLETIGEEAFGFANVLTTLIVPSSITSIGREAFSGTGSLLELRFNSDPTIGPAAFEGLPEEAEIFVPFGATAFSGPEWSEFEISYEDPPVSEPITPIVPTYRIYYYGNSYEATSVPVDYAGYFNGGEASITQSIPIRTGYTFLGWNTAEYGSGATYMPGGSLAIGSSDVPLFAQWKINLYRLTFNPNGGPALARESLTQEYGSTTEIPILADNELRTGYTFLNWNTAPDGSGRDYKPLTVFKFEASDLALYAKWKINSYQVKYDGNGQEIGRVPESKVKEFNSVITVNSPSARFVKKGYSFQGWNTKINGSGSTYKPGEVFRLGAGDEILYAMWSPNTYQIKFLNNSKNPLPSGEFQAGGTIHSAPIPAAREGYTFKGWSAKPSRIEVIAFPYTPGVTRAISLYAVWVKNK